MKKQLVFALAGLLLCLLIVSGTLAQGTTTVDWGVISSGGGPSTDDGGVALNGTLGQPIAGLFSNLPVSVGSGYWRGVEKHYRVYLPVVLRND